MNRLIVLCLLVLGATAHAGDWWDKEWTVRKKITVDTAKGAPISEPIGTTVALIRLHAGNYQFAAGREDISDIRFVAEDNKTLLTYHLERFDSTLQDAFLWVKLPDVKPGAVTTFWLYYGNTGPKSTNVSDAKATYDADTVLVYHFGERNAPPTDATKNSNTAQAPGVGLEGALIGGGLRLLGTPLTIPSSDSLAWQGGTAATLSFWVKLPVLPPKGIVLSRREEDRAFVVGIDAGIPYVEISDAAGPRRTAAGAAMTAGSWSHLAAVAETGKVTLYLNGVEYGNITGGLPALAGPLLIGGDTVEGAVGLKGELDELEISKVARPVGALKLAALSQSGDPSSKALIFAEDEGGGSGGGHGGHFAVIVNSLTFDGWLTIIILAFMAALSWYVMVSKVAYLNAVAKGNKLFMKEWAHLASDLTALDDGDAEKFKSLGGRVDAKGQRALRKSSVYRLYHIGAEEIRHRMAAERSTRALSGRSIQSIRAALDGGLVREKQTIDRLIVLLTICISGGPFLGLLGTVVGVMITFAAVAAAGDVNVNAIAPGIAAALLATVAGLAVAIPALFGYNYILSRVKEATADMHVFIDEFVTKMAEFYSGTEEEKPRSNHAPLTAASLMALLQNFYRANHNADNSPVTVR